MIFCALQIRLFFLLVHTLHFAKRVVGVEASQSIDYGTVTTYVIIIHVFNLLVRKFVPIYDIYFDN